ncbi:MAG: DNA/RNA nuclease SfsA [Planctomycetota bacterium]|nr:DNA/RNA nuclease SfsA [Planctomycetota bacterium]
MNFPLPILRGTLLRRYKRFLADVELESGALVVAHCPNSGSMKTCAEPGRPVLLSDHGPGTPRKLRYTWEAIRMGRAWVGVNTLKPNRVVHEAVAAGKIPELAGYAEHAREVVYGARGRSRIDVLLSGHRARPDCYVEVKNTTMRVGEGSLFPDAVTERGRKHLEDLAREVRRGRRALIFFFVGRADCAWMGPADAIDPAYGRALRRAVKAGVEPLAYQARVTPRGIALVRRVEVRL